MKLEIEIICFECDEPMEFMEYSCELHPKMQCPMCKRIIILDLIKSI